MTKFCNAFQTLIDEHKRHQRCCSPYNSRHVVVVVLTVIDNDLVHVDRTHTL